MAKKNYKLTPRQKAFCVYYADSADMTQAAIDAGYKKNPYQKARTLLSRSDIADEIVRVISNRKKIMSHMALVGYEKLALGSIADSVSLLYMESVTKDELRNLDMSCVSEIKKLKDGAMEIKFFDRNKALEKLMSLEDTSQSNTGGLVQALMTGAKNLSIVEGDYDGV